MSYDYYNGCIFPSPRHTAGAIAYDWMTAHGLNTPSVVDQFMPDGSYALPPSEAAFDCLNALGLDSAWLEERGLTSADIVTAFEEFYKFRPDRR